MLAVPSPKSHSTDVMSPSDAFVNSTVSGASPDSTSIENDAVGGTRGGAGISVDVGVTVGGNGVDVGVSTRVVAGLGARLGVSVSACGVAVAVGVSVSSEGIKKSHAGRLARINVKYVRKMNVFFFTFGAPGIFSSN